MSDTPRSSPGDGEALVRRSWNCRFDDAVQRGRVAVGHDRCQQASIRNDRLISEWLGSFVVCETIGTGVMLNS